MERVDLIPIFGIFMIIAIVIGPVWIRSHFASREREQLQVTIRTAIEKGQPLPPELVAAMTTAQPDVIRGPENDLRRGLVLLFVGLGLAGLGFCLLVGLGSIAGPHVGDIVGYSVAGSGAIPGLVGVAYLILFSLRRGQPAQ